MRLEQAQTQEIKAINRQTFLRLATLATVTGIIQTAQAFLNRQNDTNIELTPQTHEQEFTNDIVNILLLSDIHNGDKDSNKRQANSQVPTILESLIKNPKLQNFDLGFQLGDIIREVDDENENKENLKHVVELCAQFPFPITHLLGNHDLWGLDLEQIQKLFQELNLPNNFYGFLDLPNHQIAWLDLTAQKNHHGYLPKERIEWLNDTLDPLKPIILFSHYGFFPQDSEGSYYFKNNSRATALQNGPKAWEMIKHLPIQAVISGHIHWIAYSKV